MSKTYIAPYDFVPRTTGELRIAKNDHIITSDIGNGWCWGRNMTQGGLQGVFPKRYLSTTRSGTSDFNRAVDQVASVCSRVDMLIAESAYLISEQDRASLLNRQATLHSLGPFSYLISGCAGRIWEECFQNFVSAFQETKVKAHEYLRCVESLKRLAGMLEKYMPQLSEEVRKYSQVLPAVLQNAECMQATLKGLISIALAAFDLYAPRDVSNACLLSLPPRSLTSLSGSTLHIVTSTDQAPSPSLLVLPPANPHPSLAKLFLLSYPTLQALTILTCIIACCLQFRSYTLSSHAPGDVTAPDFYNDLQSVLMQLLTTYTGLVPAIRSKTLRGLISVFWISFLSVAGVVLNFAAVGIYFHDGGMAPLLGFFGNVVQAVTVLQLAVRIDDQGGGAAVMTGEEHPFPCGPEMVVDPA